MHQDLASCKGSFISTGFLAMHHWILQLSCTVELQIMAASCAQVFAPGMATVHRALLSSPAAAAALFGLKECGAMDMYLSKGII